jgi:chromate transporter
LRVFAWIGCLSFGGPAGQVALMHRELVDKRQWVSEGQYLRALNFCHLLPGPEAQQLATWIGWKLHGVRGGLAAGLLFVIPGALVMLALSFLYVAAVGAGWFAALFLGIKAAVLALVGQAVLRIGGRALKTSFSRWLAVVAFAGLFLFNLPFPLIVLGAGAIGIGVTSWRPAWLHVHPVESPASPPPIGLWRRTVTTVMAGLILWLAPLALILLLLGPDHILAHLARFFGQLAVVSFGGAYAVLSYMAQEAVQTWHWLAAGEMADGLGLAETTPGPLIMVTQFVGFLAAWRSPMPFSPALAGTLGALVTTWVTFAPCFLWIFAFAPWMERLEHARRLQGGLTAVTSAVVGVIANLALWFALHLLFARIGMVTAGPLHLSLPDPATFNLKAAVLALMAALLLFRWRTGVFTMLASCGLAGLVLSWIA